VRVREREKRDRVRVTVREGKIKIKTKTKEKEKDKDSLRGGHQSNFHGGAVVKGGDGHQEETDRGASPLSLVRGVLQHNLVLLSLQPVHQDLARVLLKGAPAPSRLSLDFPL